jgi:ArsR family transcriptional regulator, arsenate/arsenite/antimonite-responsive transcriptional repressor
MKTSQALASLAALAQETRLAVYRLLVAHAPDGLPAGRIADELGVAPSSLSFHFKELSHAGLIGARQEGRFVWYSADLEAMTALVDFLTANCCSAAAVCDPKCAPKGAPKQVAVSIAPPLRRRRA